MPLGGDMQPIIIAVHSFEFRAKTICYLLSSKQAGIVLGKSSCPKITTKLYIVHCSMHAWIIIDSSSSLLLNVTLYQRKKTA